MSSFLYDLGRSCFHRRKTTVGVWLALLAVIAGSVALFADSFQDDFDLPGAEAQEALDSLALTFPEVSGASAQVIVVAADGDRIDEDPYRTEIEDAVEDWGDLDHVEVATSPYDEMVSGTISEEDSAVLISLQYDEDVANLPESTLTDLETAVDDLVAQLPDGTQGSPGGELFQTTAVHLSIVEVIGVIVAFVVLFLTLGSLWAAGMPLISALLSVAIGLLLVVLATGFFSVNSTTPMLALMLGLAVGIDYALFIVSRHRAFLEDGLPADEAAARATATSGSAVVFAGVTVMVALTGLSVAGIPFLAVMGIAAAVTVAIAVAVSLTLLPALLGFAGDRLRPKPRRSARRAGRAAVAEAAVTDPARQAGGRADSEPAPAPASRPSLAQRFYTGWVSAAIKWPALTIIVIIVGLSLFLIPASKLQLALPNGGGGEPGSAQKVSYDLIEDEFGAGFNGPLVVTADIISSDDPLGDIEAMADDIEEVEGVEQVIMATPNRNADTGIIQVIPTTAPDAPATEDTVERIRALEPQFLDDYGFQIAVTGATALAIDISTQLGGALLPFGVFVVGFSLILLMVVFRSIVVPIKATLGFLLSVITSFGVVVLVFHEGLLAGPLGITETGPVISFLPIILMGILFGLAMDYEVFLVSGMREAYVHGADARTAVVKGFVSSAKVVTAAAVIMIAVFGAFVPTGDAIIKSIALGLAVGVFTDAFLVRMTLVPAVLALLGDRAWTLPRWLDRLLPRVDVEGEGLVHQVALRDWPAPESDHQVYGEGLALEHGDGSAVYRDIDVAVSRGDVLAVSGHGTSALLLTLSGRVVPDHGELKIAGMVVPEENRKIRRVVPFLTLDSPDAGLMVDAATMRSIAKNPPDLLVIDHADRAHDTETADAVATLVGAAVQHGSAVILGLVDQRVDWMMPPHTRYSLLDLEADRLAPLASGGAHS